MDEKTCTFKVLETQKNMGKNGNSNHVRYSLLALKV